MYPAVVAGQRVVAYHTILGTVLPRCLHVHLSEIDSFRIHNPVDPGHLEPYVDHTVLVVETVEFAKPGGGVLEPDPGLPRLIQIAADATDTPAVPVPRRVVRLSGCAGAGRLAAGDARRSGSSTVADGR
jgi:hypothetical protein